MSGAPIKEIVDLLPNLPKFNAEDIFAINLLSFSSTLKHPKQLIEFYFHLKNQSYPLNFYFKLQWEQDIIVISVPYDSAEIIFSNYCKYPVKIEEIPLKVVTAVLQSHLDQLLVNTQFQSVNIELMMDIPDAKAYPFLLGVRTNISSEFPVLYNTVLHLNNLQLRKFANFLFENSDKKEVDLSVWNNINVPTRLELGYVLLEINDIFSIRKHDVILLDSAWGNKEDNEFFLCVNKHMGILVIHNDDQFIAKTGLIMLADDEMPVHEQNTEDGDSVGLLGQVPLRISFDLGSVNLTFGELNKIVPGYIFNHALPLHKSVSLRINGVLVGEGNLVDIDGRIGVAVTRFTAPKK